MFSVNLRESKEEEVEIKETSAVAFKQVLQYLYTGQVNLCDMKLVNTLELLGITHLYGIVELQIEIADYLQQNIENTNVCEILVYANTYSLQDLAAECLDIIDVEAENVLKTEGFSDLPIDVVELVLERENLMAPEIEIFHAVENWIKSNHSSDEEKKRVLKHIWLQVMAETDILGTVRAANLIDPCTLLDALTVIKQSPPERPGFRFPVAIGNVATIEAGARVTEGNPVTFDQNGDLMCLLLHGDFDPQTYVQHEIGVGKGITIRLNKIYAVNNMGFRLLNQYSSQHYSYYVETSLDGKKWTRIVDKTQEECKGCQSLTFTRRPVLFVRIVGTRSYNGKTLDVTYIYNVSSVACKSVL